MDQFIAKHADKLQGTLSCFDRVLFRGYLPFFSGYAMASFLETRGVYRRDVKRFVLTQAYRLKDHARQLAAREGRPYQYFGERTRKEDLARELALWELDRTVSLVNDACAQRGLEIDASIHVMDQTIDQAVDLTGDVITLDDAVGHDDAAPWNRAPAHHQEAALTILRAWRPEVGLRRSRHLPEHPRDRLPDRHLSSADPSRGDRPVAGEHIRPPAPPAT